MPDQFDAYYAVFVAAGKPLGEADRRAACMEWVSYNDTEPAGWKAAAIIDAQAVCAAASSAKYVPRPVAHLRTKPWTRTVAPRPEKEPRLKWETGKCCNDFAGDWTAFTAWMEAI